jgi:hypothetical protein
MLFVENHKFDKVFMKFDKNNALFIQELFKLTSKYSYLLLCNSVSRLFIESSFNIKNLEFSFVSIILLSQVLFVKKFFK